MNKLDEAQVSAGKKKEAVKTRKPSMGRSRKGRMRGKGGPENALCTYRGVRQWTWGKWVAEIREPNCGARLWLGTFNTSLEAALAYNKATKKLYGPSMRLNLPAMMTAITAPPIDNDDDNSNFSVADSSNSCISEQAVKNEAIDASSHDPFVMRDETTSGTMGDADYNCVDWSWENLVVPDMVSEDQGDYKCWPEFSFGSDYLEMSDLGFVGHEELWLPDCGKENTDWEGLQVPWNLYA